MVDSESSIYYYFHPKCRFLPLFDSGSVWNIANVSFVKITGVTEQEGAATVSCSWEDVHLQLLSDVTNSFYLVNVIKFPVTTAFNLEISPNILPLLSSLTQNPLTSYYLSANVKVLTHYISPCRDSRLASMALVGAVCWHRSGTFGLIGMQNRQKLIVAVVFMISPI